MLIRKVLGEEVIILKSIVYSNCYDIFNCRSDLKIIKNGVSYVALNFKILSDAEEQCLLVDRYGFCVTNKIELENMVIKDDVLVWVKLINRSNIDVRIPYGEIIGQIMCLPTDFVDR